MADKYQEEMRTVLCDIPDHIPEGAKVTCLTPLMTEIEENAKLRD